jgi:hypothetical protein
LPAAAGRFYPDDPDELQAAVDAVMEPALRQVDPGTKAPKAVIAPHAGYIYSGPVAASAYARLASARDTIRRVVLLGPAHREPNVTVAASSADVWATPLGDVTIDVAGRDALLASPPVVVDDGAHRFEHSLEVHLPFVQAVLGDVEVLPLVTGRVSADVVADVLGEVWGGPETAIVVSSDLSHYHDHATAARLDRETAEAIVDRRPEGVGLDRACGVFALRGLLVAARNRQLDISLLDLRTSADTAGPPDRVVGYGSFAVTESDGGDDAVRLTEAEIVLLLDLAEDAIQAGLSGREPTSLDPSSAPPALLRPSGVFVTLEVAGLLNGCIGAIEPAEPLVLAVPRLAVAAAFDDPRLPRLTGVDWPDLTIKVSILSALTRHPAATLGDVTSRLRAGSDGLVLALGRQRATFLPTMWEKLPEPADFVGQLLRKAAIPADPWPAGLQAWTYTTVELSRSRSRHAGRSSP